MQETMDVNLKDRRKEKKTLSSQGQSCPGSIAQRSWEDFILGDFQDLTGCNKVELKTS